MNAHTLTGAGGIAAGGVAGIFGDATDFDGTDDVITTDADGSFGTDGFTMMFWLNLDAVGWQGAMGDDTDDHIMRPRNTNLMNFQSLGAGSRRNLESASTITLSAWEHWAGSRGAAGGALYRDGSLDQSDAHVANAATAADPLVLGRKGTDEINGQMQEFQYHLTQRSAGLDRLRAGHDRRQRDADGYMDGGGDIATINIQQRPPQPLSRTQRPAFAKLI